MKNEFHSVSRRIAERIHSSARELDDSHYGKTFASWLFYLNGYPDWKKPLADWMEHVPRKEFHWEFHNLALIHLYEKTLDPDIRAFLLHHTRNRHVQHTNWRLMRALYYAKYYRLVSSQHVWARRAHHEIRASIQNRTNGFFLDEKGKSASLQYHAFSTLLLHWISLEPGFEKYADVARLGASILRQFMLPHGEINYMGRGQHQLFGAAAAMALFCHAGQHASAQNILRYMCRFENRGIFPLVLTPDETEKGTREGWYSYNRLYDYLPFAGVMIHLAGEAFSRKPKQTVILGKGGVDFPFAGITEKNKKKIVVSIPTHASLLSEYIPWPMVGFPEKSFFLAQGGPDSNHKTAFSAGAPFFETAGGVEFAALDGSELRRTKNGFVIRKENPSYDFQRTIDFNDRKLIIHDLVHFTRDAAGKLCVVNVPVGDFSINEKRINPALKKMGFTIDAPVSLQVEDAVSAMGTRKQLRGYRSGEFSRGTKFETVYSISLKKGFLISPKKRELL